jgi:hypothetical protein
LWKKYSQNIKIRSTFLLLKYLEEFTVEVIWAWKSYLGRFKLHIHIFNNYRNFWLSILSFVRPNILCF